MSAAPGLPSQCPSCGGPFVCGASQGVCDCFSIQLSPAQQAALAQAYPGACLCLACLRALAEPAPTQPR